MNYRRALIALLLGLFVMAAMVAAQTPRRARPATQGARSPATNSTTPKPASASSSSAPADRGTAATTTTPPPAGTLAMVNGQAITLADIDSDVRSIIGNSQDPYLQAFYDDPEKEAAAARTRALDARTRSMLIEAEAKRRNVTVGQLVEAEINSRIPAPTEEEIRSVYEQNHAQMSGADLESVRPQIVNYLRGKASERLYAELATRLRMTNTVKKGAEVNAPNLSPGAVLVTVGDRPFTAAMLDQRMRPYLYKLRLAVYEAEKSALDKKINDILLMTEVRKRNVPPENIIRDEITSKIHHPTEADVAKFYRENKERITGDLDSTRADIANYLEQQEQERVELALAEKLRAGAQVRVLLMEPEPPVQSISLDDDPSRGDPKSPVTLVEFTDFQCPACGAVYPVLEEVLRSYGNRVRFVVRDFPLGQHEFARKAAEAADAANAQGKFFEYINLLFTHQKALDVESLKKYASQLGLDRARFDAALDRGDYAAEVQHDVDDGEMYGVDSTPTIYVNGVRVMDLSDKGIRAAIERAFARAGQSPVRAAN